MSNFIIQSTPINNLQLIKQKPIIDDRGFLSRIFCQKTFNNIMQDKTIKQINRTFTLKKGTVRGLHFQYPPYAETKIVTCLKGKVWDVAVDLRKGSKTFLHHHAVLLTEDNYNSFLIPEGFAHGFQTLTTQCEMLYFHTSNYKQESEGGLNVLDPLISINWPQEITERSKRDTELEMLKNNFNGIIVNEL
ncbi:dTDP-4-dehydrorhamnose 3,5-epimerase family protein [Candidatus Pelagibacter sp.]|nr:dTDP-4-dehydrorhamnose 3,5-epimerase family protein [Candidatus Pelagibacter sp.]